MGSKCCGSSKNQPTGEETTDYIDKPRKTETRTNEPSRVPQSTLNIHSSTEILDDNFKNEIIQTIRNHTATVPSSFQNERNRIVNEMERAAPDRYLGLFYAEYPHINGPTVNAMAKRFVASKDIKQRLADQIAEDQASHVQSRTANWKSSDRDNALQTVRAFIEKTVNEEFDSLIFE